MFGVEQEGVSYFDQRYKSDSDSYADANGAAFSTLRSASKRLLKKIRRATSITRH